VNAIDALLANAGHYADTFTSDDLPARPATGVAVVACMDARIDVYSVLGLEPGGAHVIRNAGGVVTDDVIRSLTVSQRLLGTTEVMLIHHSNCGMQTFTDDELKARIEADTGLRPPFAIEAFTDLDAEVRQSIARVKTSPYLPQRGTVRGFVYEVESGRLREIELLSVTIWIHYRREFAEPEFPRHRVRRRGHPRRADVRALEPDPRPPVGAGRGAHAHGADRPGDDGAGAACLAERGLRGTVRFLE
jgi:carbonic anhydrase